MNYRCCKQSKLVNKCYPTQKKSAMKNIKNKSYLMVWTNYTILNKVKRSSNLYYRFHNAMLNAIKLILHFVDAEIPYSTRIPARPINESRSGQRLNWLKHETCSYSTAFTT